ncbi:MAG: LapA family protein [Carbonactinosporaceae bacterium]
MTQQMPQAGPQPGWLSRHMSPRLVVGVVLAVLAVVFVVENGTETRIRVLIPVISMPLWIALAGTLVVGFVAGFLISARRHR